MSALMEMFGLNTKKVSLVTSDFTPATKKATTSFALFKMVKPVDKKKLEKIESMQKKLMGE
jgi:hypothetical protein